MSYFKSAWHKTDSLKVPRVIVAESIRKNYNLLLEGMVYVTHCFETNETSVKKTHHQVAGHTFSACASLANHKRNEKSITSSVWMIEMIIELWSFFATFVFGDTSNSTLMKSLNHFYSERHYHTCSFLKQVTVCSCL